MREAWLNVRSRRTYVGRLEQSLEGVALHEHTVVQFSFNVKSRGSSPIPFLVAIVLIAVKKRGKQDSAASEDGISPLSTIYKSGNCWHNSRWCCSLGWGIAGKDPYSFGDM